MNHVRTITHPLFFGIVVVAMFMMSFGQLALLFRMVAEINSQREGPHHFGYWWWSPLKTWRVVSAHRQLFPDSRSRLVFGTSLAMTFICFFTLVEFA
jgi:hypothetical protein